MKRPDRSRSRAGWALRALTLAVLLAPGACTPAESRGGVAAGPTAEVTALRWFRDGKQILIAPRWVARSATLDLRPIDAGAEGRSGWSVSVSPGGRTLLWFDGDRRFELLSLDTSSRESVAVPVWLTQGELLNVLGWVADDEISLVQLDRSNPAIRACGRFDPASRAWRQIESERCIDGSFYRISAFELAGPDTVVVYSSGEGINAVDLVSTSAASRTLGSFETPAPAPVQVVRFGPAEALVVMQCELDLATRDCVEAAASSWALYRWTLGPDVLSLLARGLPTGARLSPDGSRIAWIEGSDLCVRALLDSDRRCTRL